MTTRSQRRRFPGDPGPDSSLRPHRRGARVSRRFWPTTGSPTTCASRPRRWACSATRSRRSGAGSGSNLAQDVELAMELGYTSLALRSMFGTNNGIAGQVLVGFGTDEQKARWLEPMASGDVVASFALTEPGAGSNPSGLRTKAVRDGRRRRIGSSTARSASSPMRRRRSVHRLRPHPAGRRRRRGHRGLPGARRHRRRRGRRQGRQDGPGRRVDLRRQLRRRPRARTAR